MRRGKTTRRKFLRSTVLGVASAAATAGRAELARPRERDPGRDQLERIVERYGSELGHLRKAGR